MPPRRSREAGESSQGRGRRDGFNPNNPFGLAGHALNRYQSIKNRPIVPSKYLDPATLHDFGILPEVQQMMESIGWTDWFRGAEHTYAALTLEFLSTLEGEVFPENFMSSKGSISFQMQGTTQTLSVEQANEAFGFPLNGVACKPPGFDAICAWRQLADDDQLYNTRYSKATKLRNPLHRVIHKAFAHSVQGRYDSSGVVNNRELIFLWCLENRQLLNGAPFVISHLLAVAPRKTGPIVVGGLITRIARYLGFIVFGALVDCPILVDGKVLHAMGMARFISRGRYAWNPYGQAFEDDNPEDEVAEPPLQQYPAALPAPPPVPPMTLEQLAQRMDAHHQENQAQFQQVHDRFHSLEHSFSSFRDQYHGYPPPPTE